MEPVRGGKLASLNETANALLKQARPDDSIASWAFRYLQSLPNAQVVLSGMSTMEQLKENIALFEKADPTTEAEKALLQKAVAAMADIVPCTACRYCCDDCPQGLDIPKLISLYNQLGTESPAAVKGALAEMDAGALPSACIACGACARVCPQGIDVPDVLSKFAQAIA
jgi:predicted aldo/keto reductase-like oxidoreductase